MIDKECNIRYNAQKRTKRFINILLHSSIDMKVFTRASITTMVQLHLRLHRRLIGEASLRTRRSRWRTPHRCSPLSGKQGSHLWLELNKWGEKYASLSRVGYSFATVSILSWSNFISKSLFTKCKFIPSPKIKHLKHYPKNHIQPWFNFQVQVHLSCEGPSRS
jgi:hypothetical protein